MVVRTRKTLVMWSGGLDSTYGLVRLLRETQDEVHAHHIHRLARHDSGKRACLTYAHEAEAIARMRPLIEKSWRPFHYTESAVDLRDFSSFARDTATAMFFAAQAAKSAGFTARDRILLSFNRDEDADWNPGSELYNFLRMVTLRLLKVTWGGEEVPQCFLWKPPPSKQEEAESLPLALFRMTASCRDPQRIEPGKAEREPPGRTTAYGWRFCGNCPECRTLAKVVHPEEKDATPQNEAAAHIEAGRYLA